MNLSALADDLPGSWADWTSKLAKSGKVGDSGQVIILADQLAKSAAISTEAATALLLWLGSVCMLNHAKVQWPSGIWQPAGLTMSIVEEDGVQIDAITNAFIGMTQSLGIDPIHDTVKEGPAGLIARLESSGNHNPYNAPIKPLSLDELSKVDTSLIAERTEVNRGNARALIYPSGRALLSYLYDTPFFNTLDELIQHGNLNVRGKLSSHSLSKVHMTTVVNFYQGALVTLTNDSRVQNNMSALLRQMLIFWPTAGTRRHKEAGRIDVCLHTIENKAREGIKNLKVLSDGLIYMPHVSESMSKSMLSSGEGVGVRYTVLNRVNRIQKIALAVAFWRIVAGGDFVITSSDLAMADAILHGHEMGGRLYELVMTKGKLGHEFMRLFVRLLEGDDLGAENQEIKEKGEIAHASELSIGATALARLNAMSITGPDGQLADEYRFITGDVIREHRRRWKY